MHREWPSPNHDNRTPWLRLGRLMYWWFSEAVCSRDPRQGRTIRCFRSIRGAAVLAALLLGGLLFGPEANGQAEAATFTRPSRSTTIALTTDNRRLVVVNRETNSVSVIRVRNFEGEDTSIKLAEIPVGIEPRCVALSPNNLEPMSRTA
jgi:hypothetical protein